MAVNLVVDFADGRYGTQTQQAASDRIERLGFALKHAPAADDRLSAWIDWQFAPSWWSSEARRGEVWYALDASGAIAGFVTIDARGLRFPWLRGYALRPGVGLFGPFGVAPEHRGGGLGAALLDIGLGALHARGYAEALIAAVGFERLIAMYRQRTGARVCETFSYAASRRYRTTILASGEGTNAQNVLDEVATGHFALEIGSVISNIVGAGVLERATAAGVATQTVVWNRDLEDRSNYDRRLLSTVAAGEPELLLLLGWMHRLAPAFIERFPEILNVHPAFLPFDGEADDVVVPDGATIPAFRGAHAVRDALAAGVPWLGASVHNVTAEIDRGSIMVRTPMRYLNPDRDAVMETLRPIEHAAVGAAIRRWCFER